MSLFFCLFFIDSLILKKKKRRITSSRIVHPVSGSTRNNLIVKSGSQPKCHQLPRQLRFPEPLSLPSEVCKPNSLRLERSAYPQKMTEDDQVMILSCPNDDKIFYYDK